ncbi:MAG: hypothetical protein ACRELF_01705 [Gemmataceae bacterium]
MILFLALVALLLVLFYFWNQRRHRDDAWQRFRQRHRERLRHHPSEQPIDPNFQFDPHSAESE